LVKIAFKFFNSRDEEAKQLKGTNTCTKYQMQSQSFKIKCPIPDQKTYPKDTASSLLKPASDVETQGIGQKLAHTHQQNPVHSVDNAALEDGLSRGKQYFPHSQPQIPDSAPAKDPSLMFPLDD
jgi:hypothetical protein